MSTDRSHGRAILAQHAKTAQLMGVDAVPVFRFGEDADEHAGPVTDGAETVTSSFADEPAPPAGTIALESTGSEALDALRDRYIADAPHDRFGQPFKNIVFGEGDPNARLMFVGEAPGADEDATGRPFVGRAGQLLDKMIVAMGLRRDKVYIANVLKTRPPNNQTPTIDEAEASAPYLFEQIRIVQPEAIVTLGLPATKLLLGVDDSMGRLRARWAEFARPAREPQGAAFDPAHPDDRTLSGEPVGPIPVMPTYHPAYLLRSYTPENRSKVWADLNMVMERLGLEPRKRGSG